MLKEFIRQKTADILPLHLRSRLYSLLVPGWKRKRRDLLKWLEHVNDQRLFCGESNSSAELFKKFVYVIHLEISSFCNRACSYCPNYFLHSTRKQKTELPKNLFLQCLEDLKSIHYDKFIEFNGFNEPLYDRTLFLKRAKQVKTFLPESSIVINTNGDYLDEKYFYEISESGIDFLCITSHLTENECLKSEAERQKKASKFFEKFAHVNFTPEKNWWTAQIGGMKVFFQLSTYNETGHNWGSSIGDISLKRTEPCFVPAKHVYVDYRGRVNLCCSVNMDCNGTDDFCAGQIGDKRLFDIYDGKKAAKIRHALLNMRDVPQCCRYCTAQRNYIHNSHYIDIPYDFILKNDETATTQRVKDE